MWWDEVTSTFYGSLIQLSIHYHGKQYANICSTAGLINSMGCVEKSIVQITTAHQVIDTMSPRDANMQQLNEPPVFQIFACHLCGAIVWPNADKFSIFPMKL